MIALSGEDQYIEIMDKIIRLPEFSHAGFHRRQPGAAFHKHAGTEIICMLRGSCRIESPLGTFHGTPGKFLVIPPGISHNQVNDPGEENLYCVFQADSGLFRTDWRSIEVARTGEIRKIFFELYRMTAANDKTGAEGLLYTLLVRLSKLEEQNSEYRTLPGGLQRALAYMHNHYREPVNVAMTARAAGVSESYLRTLFQQYFQDSPLHYLHKLRLGHAKNLLHDPNCSVGEAAESCGFENMNYFVRLYRKFYGLPPGQDRWNANDSVADRKLPAE